MCPVPYKIFVNSLVLSWWSGARYFRMSFLCQYLSGILLTSTKLFFLYCSYPQEDVRSVPFWKGTCRAFWMNVIVSNVIKSVNDCNFSTSSESSFSTANVMYLSTIFARFFSFKLSMSDLKLSSSTYTRRKAGTMYFSITPPSKPIYA